MRYWRIKSPMIMKTTTVTVTGKNTRMGNYEITIIGVIGILPLPCNSCTYDIL